MLTRLEVDGFKNLLGVDVDFGPYTCIAGPNAIGKSNLFDAIEFLALLADGWTFVEAAARIRNAGTASSDLDSLFWQGAEPGARLKFGVEFTVPSDVRDDLGRDAKPTMTFLRYELELAYTSVTLPDGSLASEGLSLVSEKLAYIAKGDAVEHLPWTRGKKAFRDAVVRGRRTAPYISTSEDGGARIIEIHQDGGSRGQTRKSLADRAPRTVVGTTATSDDPTILAARREMQSWRILALEPSALRRPDLLTDPDVMDVSGAHMPAALRRIAMLRGEDAEAEVTAIAGALTDVRSIHADVDPVRRNVTLRAAIKSGPQLPARSLSDGTLRFLALAILSLDPEYEGLLCMEEPENGIHPARVAAMAQLVRSIAVDENEQPGPDNPMRQVIVNTHSPHFVTAQDEDDLLFAETSTVVRDGRPAVTVRFLPMVDTWRSKEGRAALAKQDILDYLKLPDDSPLLQRFPLSGERVG